MKGAAAALAAAILRVAIPCAALGLALVGPAPRPAFAQAGAPQVTSSASANLVEVGEVFTIELKALGDQSAPQATDPELRAPPAFTARGPSVSTQTFMQFGGGGSSIKVGIGATWRLVANQPGRYSIPGPSVLWNGKRIQTNAVVIEVVAAGKKPKQRNIFDPFDNPFLMPGGPGKGLPWPFGEESPEEEEEPDASSLSMPKAPDDWIFLRAVPDKKTAVVGEQITVSFYIYYRTDYKIEEWHEAPLSDFRRFPLLKNPGTEPVVMANVGGQRFHTRVWDRVAVFPLRAGELHTGSLKMRFTARRIGRHNERASDDQIITVTEPPRDNRPPGYAIGDVGRFSLSATVTPRRIEQGGAASVLLKVTGTGNLPQSLRVPERTGIEWLDPEKKESIEAQGNTVAGWRSFGYVVRVKDSGKVDLGTVELPYWDPEAKRYQIEKAVLGTLDVTPVAPVLDPSTRRPTVTTDLAKNDPFAALAGPRKALSAFVPAAGPPWQSGATLWLLVAAPPFAVALGFAGAGAARRARARRAAKKDAPAALAARALAEAREAEARGDTKEVAAALERALHLAIEGATGLKSRGVLLADLPAELEARGLDRALADEASGALAACESLRFDPAAEAAARDLGERARAVVSALEQKGAR